MSEQELEAVSEVEVGNDGGESQEASASHQQEPTQEDQGKQGNGRDYAPYVDLSDLPEEKRTAIEARIRHISSQTKREIERATRKWQEIASAQSEQIEHLTSGFSSVATQLHDRTLAETESRLAQQANEAWEAGDTRKYHEINREIMDIRVKKGIEEALAAKTKEQPKKVNRPAAPVDDGYIDPAVRAWQDETDDLGAPVRPWAQPGEDGYFVAVGHLQDIKNNPRMANYNETQIMQELDRRMNTAKSAPKPAQRQQVMGGNLTRGGRTSKVNLHPKAEEIAVRMKLGGPNATREQHIQAYYESQLEETKRKGTR